MVKAKTAYIYDVYGNVTEERRYKDDMVGYVSRTFSYLDNVSMRPSALNFDGAYLTSTSVQNVRDADGANPETVGESAKYDLLGRLVSRTDANGNTTQYTYDQKGRVTKETLPGGAERTYTYNDDANLLLFEDELGNETKYQYDVFGNLTEVTDVISGEVLAALHLRYQVPRSTRAERAAGQQWAQDRVCLRRAGKSY